MDTFTFRKHNMVYINHFDTNSQKRYGSDQQFSKLQSIADIVLNLL